MKYEEATITELREALDSNTISAVELLKESKRVIRERDNEVKAFVEVFESAEEDAKRADTMIKRRESNIAYRYSHSSER